MADTYSQLYIQVVFAVKYRQNLIHESFENEVYKYIAGIIQAKKQKSIIVNGVEDHIHCFIGLKPNIAISDLVREIKNNSSNFINESKFINGKFSWQEGFGAFSYSHSHIQNVYNYILNQKEHHKKQTFKEEYLRLLDEFEVKFKSEYLFNFLENPDLK